MLIIKLPETIPEPTISKCSICGSKEALVIVGNTAVCAGNKNCFLVHDLLYYTSCDRLDIINSLKFHAKNLTQRALITKNLQKKKEKETDAARIEALYNYLEQNQFVINKKESNTSNPIHFVRNLLVEKNNLIKERSSWIEKKTELDKIITNLIKEKYSLQTKLNKLEKQTRGFSEDYKEFEKIHDLPEGSIKTIEDTEETDNEYFQNPHGRDLQ